VPKRFGKRDFDHKGGSLHRYAPYSQGVVISAERNQPLAIGRLGDDLHARLALVAAQFVQLAICRIPGAHDAARTGRPLRAVG
jgi:hypothetical protein